MLLKSHENLKIMIVDTSSVGETVTVWTKHINLVQVPGPPGRLGLTAWDYFIRFVGSDSERSRHGNAGRCWRSPRRPSEGWWRRRAKLKRPGSRATQDPGGPSRVTDVATMVIISTASRWGHCNEFRPKLEWGFDDHENGTWRRRIVNMIRAS